MCLLEGISRFSKTGPLSFRVGLDSFSVSFIMLIMDFWPLTPLSIACSTRLSGIPSSLMSAYCKVYYYGDLGGTTDRMFLIFFSLNKFNIKSV